MAKDNNNNKRFKDTLKKSVKKNAEDLRMGRAVSLDFFKHNAWLLIAIMTAIIGVMGLRYRTKTRMSEIKTLNIQLQRAESRMLQEKATYMTLIRETELTRLTSEKHLGLTFQEEPPVTVECEEVETETKR